jgi:hypothetical protein
MEREGGGTHHIAGNETAVAGHQMPPIPPKVPILPPNGLELPVSYETYLSHKAAPPENEPDFNHSVLHEMDPESQTNEILPLSVTTASSKHIGPTK